MTYESATDLAKDAAKAEANGFPHGVSTKQVEKVKGNDLSHKSALKSTVQETFHVMQTGVNPKHHTVVLPKPVTQQIADDFNKIFKPK